MRGNNRFERFCVYCSGIIFGLIIFFLFLMSIFSTSYFYNGEHTYYLKDNPFLHMVVISAVVLIVCYFRNKIHITDRMVEILLMTVTAVMSMFVLFMQLKPVSDQYEVMRAAHGFLHGNYEAWEEGGYCFYWNHQNGIVLLFAFISMFIGSYNYLVMQLINVFLMTSSMYLIYKIAKRRYPTGRTANITAIALFMFAPFWSYVTYIYGTLYGYFAVMAGIWFLLRYFEGKSFINGILSALCMAFATIAKSNYYIMFIAVVIVIIVKVISQKKNRKKAIIALTCMILFTGISHSAVSAVISSKTGKDTPEGVPYIMWAAMGLSEGWLAPGWINGMSDYVYKDSGYNKELTIWAGKNYIKQFIEKVADDPSYGVEFFVKKTASQWNNPTFRCFELFYDRDSEVEAPKILTNLFSEGTRSNIILCYILNLAHALILFGTLMCIVFGLKHMRIEDMLTGIMFIGGFLFHLVWEAACEYTIPYFVLIIPYAVSGFEQLADWLTGLYKKRESVRRKALIKRTPAIIAVAVLILVTYMVYDKVLPDQTKEYKIYLANGIEHPLANGEYEIYSTTEEQCVLGMYDDGQTIGVIHKNSDGLYRMRFSACNFINSRKSYYIWLDESKDFLVQNMFSESKVTARRISEGGTSVWIISSAGDGKYTIGTTDGYVLERNPVNGTLFYSFRESDNDNQTWYIDKIE